MGEGGAMEDVKQEFGLMKRLAPSLPGVSEQLEQELEAWWQEARIGVEVREKGGGAGTGARQGRKESREAGECPPWKKDGFMGIRQGRGNLYFFTGDRMHRDA